MGSDQSFTTEILWEFSQVTCLSSLSIKWGWHVPTTVSTSTVYTTCHWTFPTAPGGRYDYNSHFTVEEVESERREKLPKITHLVSELGLKPTSAWLYCYYSSHYLQITCISTMVIIKLPAKMYRALAMCLGIWPAFSYLALTTLWSGYYFHPIL